MAQEKKEVTKKPEQNQEVDSLQTDLENEGIRFQDSLLVEKSD
ncbi:hypothetical protein [Maribacter halichondriae]